MSPRILWRSLEDKADPERLQRQSSGSDIVKQALPASELTRVKRRGFLTLSGAISAMASLPGCIRRPAERIMPYAEPPEEFSPGVPVHYASVLERRGEALGVLVRSHEGRPTKVEGNPDHPASLGASDMSAQAEVLELYDADRARTPSRSGMAKSYEEFDAFFKGLATNAATNNGAGLCVLSLPTNSPSFMRLRGDLQRRLPAARFYTYAPLEAGGERAGSRMAFGQPLVALPRYDIAQTILALDADFLMTEPGSVLAGRQFGRGRAIESAGSASMSRLYVVEPSLTVTGANADHRLALSAGSIGAYAKALAAELGAQGISLGEVAGALGPSRVEGIPEAWIRAVAKDLAERKGQSLIVAGSRQPAAVHALVHAMNAALGNSGRTVHYAPAADNAEKGGVEDIMALARAAAEGKVQTLLILGGNPVYDAPADANFRDLLAKIPNSVALTSRLDETGELCTWHVPRAHELESWGDQLSRSGHYSVQQPLIAPLFDARSDLDLLAALLGQAAASAHATVRATAAGRGLREEAIWQLAVQRGVASGGQGQIIGGLAIQEGPVAAAVRAIPPLERPGAGELEAVFSPDNKLLEGRYANNSWLLELPDPITRISWDNVALFAPSAARALGIANGDIVRLSAGSSSIELPAWLQPGQAPGSVGLSLGWGRTRAGRNAKGAGFNVYPLRASAATAFAKVKVEKLARTYSIAQTQEHDSMEQRPIVLEATLDAYRKQPNFTQWELPDPQSPPLWDRVDYSEGHQWGMVIDLNTCNGCSACVIACQAENNIPVVGKEQVARGREMHWLRMDRYYAGEEDNPDVAFQPMACQHCEEAPCENVCPVNATTHSPEGLNDMAYNRCIGTRYCSNNCPYKVRRFNFFNYNLEIPETRQMQFNPEVTVRFRGVMEKCTYCVQRIQNGKIAAKREGKPLPGDAVRTACQQACSSGAIVFGDINDPRSRVSKLRKVDRNYAVLADVGTHPRTRYLGKIRNPNPEMKG